MAGDMKIALARICRDLCLPVGDSYTQDWAYELPEEYRSVEHLSRYIAAYKMTEYGDAEKRLLMELMLDVANDLLERDERVGSRVWDDLAPILRRNRDLHRDQIEYWALSGERLEDAFRLTPFVRALQYEESGED